MNTWTVFRDASRTLMASSVALMALNISSVLTVRMLGIEGRGEVTAAVLIPTIIAYGGSLGLPVATSYFVNTRPLIRANIIATARTLALLLSGCFSLLSLVFVAFFPLHETTRIASMLFTVFVPINLFIFIHQAVLQADLRSMAFNTVRVVGPLFYVTILWGLYQFEAATVTTVILAMLAGNVAAFLFSTVMASSKPWFALDRTVVKALLGYGARAHLGSISPVDSLRLDQLIVALFLSTYDLGLYVIAMTFITANRMIGTSIGMIASPIAARASSANEKRKVLLLTGLVVGTTLLAGLAAGAEILFGRQLLRLLFDVSPRDVYAVLTILSVGSVFMNVRQVCSDILRGLGRPGIPSLSEFVSATALLVGVVLLNRTGLTGVAWAVSLASAFALLSLLMLGFVPRLISEFGPPFRPHLQRALLVLGSFACSAGIGVAIPSSSYQVAGVLVASVLGTVVILLTVMRSNMRGLASMALGAAALTVAMNGIRLTGGIALSDLFLIAASVILIVKLLSQGLGAVRDVKVLLQGIMMIVCGGFLGSLFAGDPVESIAKLSRFMIAAALIPILLALWKPNPAEIRRTTWLWVVGASTSAIVAVSEVGQFYQGRSDGLTLHPNHLGLASVLATGPAMALTVTARGAPRWIGILCCGALTGGVVISGSRASVLGFAVAVIAMAIFSQRRAVWGGIVLASVLAAILVLGSFIQLPAGNALSRLLGSGDSAVSRGVAESDIVRQMAHQAAVDRALAHPVTGVGFEQALAAHNIYLQIWSSAGILGIVGFALVIVAGLWGSVRLFLSRSARHPDATQLLLHGYSASFAGYLISGPFHAALWDRYIWFAPAIIAVLTAQFLAQRSSRAVPTIETTFRGVNPVSPAR